jgi:nucleotide-binding universal stress UspA family protein
VHVIPHARSSVRDDLLDELSAQASEAATKALDSAGATQAFERVHVLAGGDPEDTLATAANDNAAQGLIIGRHGPRDRDSLIRLGHVARRMVRQLPMPTMIVPPDYLAPSAPGPVVVLTDLQEDSVSAACLASKMAEALGVELVVVHVLRNPQAAFDPIASEKAPHDKAAIERWLEHLGIEGAAPMTASSDVVDAGLRIAKSRDASMLVCGSRRLSVSERIYLSSTGTELAREARCPVLLVPPTQPNA